MRRTRVLAGVLTAWAGLYGIDASAQPVLFSEVGSSRDASLEPEDRVWEPRLWDLDATIADSRLAKRNVRVDLDRLAEIREHIDVQQTPPTVVLNLLEDVRFQAVFEEAAPTLSGYSLSGRLEGEPFGTVTIVVNGNIVAGNVRTLTATYSIRSVGVGLHMVEEIESPTLDKDDGIMPSSPVAPPPASALQGEDSEIDVFVFYTPAARATLNGRRHTHAQIDLAVAETNTAYEASGAGQRIRLVGAVETRYDETEQTYTEDRVDVLERLRDDGDGHMDEIHVIRDAYAADLVHLLTDRGGGLAFVSPFDESLAFAWTSVLGGYIPSETFAHELGHNMGLQHDRYSPYNELNYPFPYSHGYVNQRAFEEGAPADTCWHTIMAYFNQCADAGVWGRKLMRFSNPNQRYPDVDGDPMGVAGEEPSDAVDGPADAVRSLNETRASVANFRASANRCSYRLMGVHDARIVIGTDGGSFTVVVKANEGCPVAAINHDDFVEIVTYPIDGAAEVAIRVAENDGGVRTGLITIMGISVEILQKGGAAVASVCTRSPWMREMLTDYAGRESCEAVTALDLADIYRLDGRGITGTIEPNDFDGLANLRVLDLRSNELSGPIPAELGRLAKLRKLYLNDNALSGPIPPELGQLDLLHLELIGNALTGPIPPELGALENLSGSLRLDDNQLSGPIPEELANLHNAWGISVAGNELTGNIPVALGSLDRIRELRLRDNELTGPVPPELGQPEHILWLSLSGNALTGCIPGGLREIEINDLDQLGLGYCAGVSLANGGPPDAPGEAGRTTEGSAASVTVVAEPAQDTAFDVMVAVSGGEAFGVARGNRTVTIPAGTTEATFSVNTEDDGVEEPDGAFTATILADSRFALMTSRSSASIVIDDDEGPAAPAIVSLTPKEGTLTVTWTAPPDGGAPISEYHIRHRPSPPAPGWHTWTVMSPETGGVLQRAITGLNDRVEHDVQVRAVSADGDGMWSETAKGTPRACPDRIDLGDCRILLAVRDTLVGSGTGLNWAIDLPIEEWTRVSVSRTTRRVTQVLLGVLGLSGTIPKELGGLTHLETLWLWGNSLTGPIPPALGRLSRLRVLLLSSNRLTGTIPRSLANLTNLTKLWLSNNDLTGCVSASLRDVSENDLDQLGLPDCPAAAVVGLDIDSTPLDGRAYGTRERIEASVRFETDVAVSGNPQLALTIGSEARSAGFVANQGKGRLLFYYLVGSADRDVNGIGIAPDALSIHGGGIRDIDGLHAVLDIGEYAIVNHPSHRVRGALRELVPNQEMEPGGEPMALDLSHHFNVPEGGTLTYASPASSNPSIATAIIEDRMLRVIPLEDGVATITVTATDSSGDTVTLTFRVLVAATMRLLRPWLIGVLAAEREAGEAEEVKEEDTQ